MIIERYEDIKKLVKVELLKMCISQKGDHFFVKPKQLARRARLTTKPYMLTIIRYALEELSKEGLRLPNGERIEINLWKGGNHGMRYLVSFPERIMRKEAIEGVKGLIL